MIKGPEGTAEITQPWKFMLANSLRMGASDDIIELLETGLVAAGEASSHELKQLKSRTKRDLSIASLQLAEVVRNGAAKDPDRRRIIAVQQYLINPYGEQVIARVYAALGIPLDILQIRYEKGMQFVDRATITPLGFSLREFRGISFKEPYYDQPIIALEAHPTRR
ncbi:hypothetical protein M1437_03345 [Patescibacteria group bacterium]|nr:hypothetical protein [Patescibacteria group bacterium]